MKPAEELVPKPPPFLDPYGSLDDSHKIKIASMMSKEDYMSIHAVRPLKGTNQIILNTLLHRFVQLLRSNGITSYTHQSDLESLVNNLRVVDGRTCSSAPCPISPMGGVTTALAAGEDDSGPDGGRVAAVRAEGIHSAQTVPPPPRSGRRNTSRPIAKIVESGVSTKGKR